MRREGGWIHETLYFVKILYQVFSFPLQTCNEEVTNAIRRNVIALGGVGIGFGVIQVLVYVLYWDILFV